MTSYRDDTIATGADWAWLVDLRDQLGDVLAHTASRPGLDEETRLAAKSALAEIAPEGSLRFQGLDPYLVEQLYAGCMTAFRALDEGTRPDARARLRVGLEQVRQAVRDLVDESPVAADRGVKEIARWLVEHAEVPQSDIAELLGTTTRTLQRWISTADAAAPSGEQATAVRALARTMNSLHHLMTWSGAVAWLSATNPQLGGRAPRDLLFEPGGAMRVARIAATLRSTVGP